MEKDEDIINKSSNSKNAKEIQMLEEDKIANENDENENGIGENEDKNLNTSCLNENGNEIIQQEKNDILLNKSDFINQKTYPKKKSFCQTRYIKRIGIIFIFIPSYLYTAIYIRINSLHLIPVKAGFIQGAIFSIFIPISFFISSIVNFNKNKKYIGKEKEVLNFEIENNVKSNLSEYMNKKYYEVYYQYITKFYFLTAFFSVLYFLSIFLFYQGISYTQPFFGQLFFSFISTIVIIFKIFNRNMKCKAFKIFSIFCMLIPSFLYMASFMKNNNIEYDDKNFIYSTIFLGCFAICQSMLIYFVKKVFKKYFYYVDVLEFVGYIGFYIFVIVPLILVILYCIFYSELINNNPSGNPLFFVIGKAFLSTCVCDLSLFYILKYFALKITCKLLVINISIIYWIFYRVTGRNKMYDDYYFLVGQGINLIVIILLIVDIYKKNIKREVYEVKKQKIKASL
jgi:hypothetical protein